MLFAFSSCGDDEIQTYQRHAIVLHAVSPSIQGDVVQYVQQRCGELNNAALAGVIEDGQATGIFSDFCSELIREVQTKGNKVFADTWVDLRLLGVKRDVMVEQKVTFEKTTDAKYYVRIDFNEVAPAGDTAKATTFLEGLLSPFALTKKTVTENKITTNTYRFYREYASEAEAVSYYHSKEDDLNKLLFRIEKEWPADVIYTGKLEFDYACVIEDRQDSKKRKGFYIVQSPSIVGKRITAVSDGPFKSAVSAPLWAETAAPYFINYKIAVDGDDTTYNVVRLGAVVAILDGGTPKYMLQFQSVTDLKLIQQDGKDVENGAVYTIE